jgi:hypothetical protein
MSTKRPDELTLDETIDDLNRRGFAGTSALLRTAYANSAPA